MKFKNYPREYERLYTNQEKMDRKLKIDGVSTFENIPKIEEYQNLLRQTYHNAQMDIFNNLVKIVWLSRRFCYHGKHREKFGSNGINMDAAFAVFIRNFIGHDSKFFLRDNQYRVIINYLYDFFPDFDINNPFEVEYKYPYVYMGLECLTLIHELDERMELLKYGEEEEMSYPKFLDYIINYTSCYNEEHETQYNFCFLTSGIYVPKVEVIKKKYEGKTSSIRTRKS